jgi:hypothetical protein
MSNAAVICHRQIILPFKATSSARPAQPASRIRPQQTAIHSSIESAFSDIDGFYFTRALTG